MASDHRPIRNGRTPTAEQASTGSLVSSHGIELEDLTFDRVQRFLRHLEEGRGNRVPTRNQRLAALHTFFEYVGSRTPEMFGMCQQIAAIPTKRTPAPATQFLERDEIAALLSVMSGVRAARPTPCPSLSQRTSPPPTGSFANPAINLPFR